jgi:SAM-dependent methyltransferase
MTVEVNVWQGAELSKLYLEGVRGAIPLAAEQIVVMLRLIQAGRPQLGRFLDLGCGDGILGRAVLSWYPEARGIFLDFSEPMLQAAQERCAALGKPGQLEFILKDYGQPDWVEAVHHAAPFDVIVSGFSIHHQPDARKRALYQEIYGLLAPGGFFLILSMFLQAPPGLKKSLMRCLSTRSISSTRKMVPVSPVRPSPGNFITGRIRQPIFWLRLSCNVIGCASWVLVTSIAISRYLSWRCLGACASRLIKNKIVVAAQTPFWRLDLTAMMPLEREVASQSLASRKVNPT